MIATALSDAELLAQARQGDEAAFTELYVRHQAAARRLASSYGRAGDPDDLVNESFERVLAAIKHGAGPDEAFRAYLFVTLRRLAADRIARIHDEPVDDVPEPIRAEQQGEPLETGEREMVLSAYESLPERWQAVLWQTAVEGRQPRDLAPTFGMSANAAAALAYRAREKLRQAYLQAHLQTAARPECEPHRSRLGAYVRDGLGRRDRNATEVHVGGCLACSALVAELRDIDRMLVRAVQPYFLVSATEVAAAAGGGAGAGAVAGRIWSKARSNPGPTAAGAAAVAAVAAAVALGLIVAQGGEDLAPGGGAPAEEAAPADGDPPTPAPPGPPTPGAPSPTQQVASRQPVPPTTAPPPTTTTAAAAAPATTAPTTPTATTPPTTATPDPTTPPPTQPPPTNPPPTQPPPPTPPPSSHGPLLIDAEINLNLLGIHLGLDLEL